MAIQRINLGTAPSGTGGDTNRTAFKKIDDNFADSANAASRQVGMEAGNVMEVGAFGLGSNTPPDYAKVVSNRGFFKVSPAATDDFTHEFAGGLYIQYNATEGFHLFTPVLPNKPPYYRKVRNVTGGQEYSTKHTFYTTENTSVDPNGFVKRASPIVSIYADKIELNDEAKEQDITFEKLGVGDYLIKGSLGFAQEGWYIEMPKDANGNVLVAVVYEQLANNDISVKTYAKKFDEETGDVVANTAKPRDIPSTRWIDLRLQALPQTDVKPFSTDETVATNAE